VAVAGDEALVAVAKAVGAADAVAVVALHHDAADDVVEAGAKAAAGDDGGGHLCGIEENFLPWARDFEGELGPHGFARREPVVEEHALGVALEADFDRAAVLERRVEFAGAE
jgi:hypothetical protein